MRILKLSQVLVSLMLAAGACVAASAQTSIIEANLPFVPSRVTERVDDTKLVKLSGNTNPMARRQFDKGLVAPSLPMEQVILVLKRSPEQEAALAAFNERQLDATSPDFHHWLHAEEFGRTYGPSDADVATLTGWLESQGFRIDTVGKGRVNIQFSGTAAQIQRAFHVEMHNYLVNGKMHIANDRDPQIPEALFPVVEGIASLHNFFGHHLSHAGAYVTRNPETGRVTRLSPQPGSEEADASLTSVRPAVIAGGGTPLHARPALTYDDGNGETHEDLAPADFAAVYNINPTFNAGITGKGVTVAITATSDVVLNDIATYRSTFKLPATTVNVIQTNSATDPGAADPGENTEDLEMVSAAAPGATLDLVVSNYTSTSSGYDLSDHYIIDNEVAPIMTVSYGACELFIGTAGNTNLNKEFQQGATEGITIFVAAGDSGSATCERQESQAPTADVYGNQVSGYAASPYVTAVGGTDFNWSYGNKPISTYWNTSNSSSGATAKGYIPEIPWNTTCSNVSLLNLFQDENGNPEFTNVEDLCNAAANDSTYYHMVTFSAGGGGYSHCTVSTAPTGNNAPDPSTCSGGYAKPSWQTGPGVPSDGKRDVPDISMFGSYGYGGLGFPSGTEIDSTAILVCQSNAAHNISCNYSDPSQIIYQENGGTSAASPFSAGVMALILQKTGQIQGLANPIFYSLAAKQSATACNADNVTAGNSCYFFDITDNSNAQVCFSGDTDCVTNTNGDQIGILSGFSAGAGYDRATGLGTMNVTNLVNAWPVAAAPTFTFSPTSLSFPSTAVGVTSANLVVTVKNTGSTSATFNTIGFAGTDPNDFTIASTTCPSPFAAGASCTVSVNFTPAAAGSRTASLSFTDSATGSPQSVPLTGTGAAAGTGLTITPSTLTFASTPVGTTTAAQVVTLKNSTAAAVSFTASTTITGSGAGSFAKTASTCTNPLAAGASCTNSFTFTPASAGALSATVTYTDSASSTPQTVALSGTGASASTGLTITPSTLTFASTPVGTTTAAQIITLKNSTSAAVSFTASTTITGTNASSFAKTASTCSNPLPAGASCTNSITFTPAAAGALSATVTYTDSASSKPQTVALSGTGASASTGLTITPSTLTFASTPVGTTTAAQMITLKNGTSSAVSFTASTTITGAGASSFTKTASTCTNPLPAGASCTNSITFTPAAAGTLTATVTYTDSASSKPQTVALTGTGASASSGLTITPSTLTFASTAVGTTTAAQMITLKNNTSAAVSFTSSTTITGPNASSFAKTASTCTNPLPAGSSCTNSITFTPAAAGTLTATVTYTDSASSTPQTVALTGTGASASSGLTITPSSLTFAATTVGTSAATQVITLKNNTSTGVNFTAATTITGANASSFAKTASTCASPLAAGASCTNTITFTPKATGTLSATVTYTDSASTTGQTVSLFGTGK